MDIGILLLWSTIKITSNTCRSWFSYVQSRGSLERWSIHICTL